jgi:serine phosphatase RsbU (regulator of sigma subunit)
MSDLRRGDFKRTLRRDLKDLRSFYIDEEREASLAKMRRLKRGILLVYWLLKSMILRLSPTRRILLLAALLLAMSGATAFTVGDWSFGINLRFIGFLILLFVLMLELKDKLLARDELEVGRTVQFALLPDRNPVLSGWEVWMFTRPANEVGGDLVDYLGIDEDRLGLTLGDVAGKGLGAALFMSKLQATMRALAPSFDSLGDLGRQMNQIFCRDGLPNRFVSMVYLEIQPGSGRVRVLNAGHIPPMIISNEQTTELPPVALALGIMPDADYAEQVVELRPDDLLLVYSDGVTEARNEPGDFFGETRLLELLKNVKGLSADAVGARLLSSVERFAGETRQSDDLSLILLKRLE